MIKNNNQALEGAVLVQLSFKDKIDSEYLREFTELSVSAGVEPLATVTGRRDVPDPKFFAGLGKVQEIQQRVSDCKASLVLFNHNLSPAQARNLEQQLKCRVLDRTELILDIFAQRASSFAGQLQVELAQLQHLSTRLVRGWTHLERQKGGIGLRGPGETQLETDRRLVKRRIAEIMERLKRVESQRKLGRQARRKSSIPQIAFVGYTNAGKSSLFNLLTGADVYAADALFATLDPTLRRIEIPSLGPAILSDTVGFIRELPHDLVAAFHATLEEVREADLLLQVIDYSEENHNEKRQEVDRVLKEIGAEDVPKIIVFNKIDKLGTMNPRLAYATNGAIKHVYLSTVEMQGIDLLLKSLLDFFRPSFVRKKIRLPVTAGKLRARLYAQDVIRSELQDDDGTWILEIEVSQQDYEQLYKNLGVYGGSLADTALGS